MALFGSFALFKGRAATEKWRQAISLDQGPIGRVCCGMNRHGLGQATWENHGRLWTQTLATGSGTSPVCFPLGPGRDPQMAVNLEGLGVVAWLVDHPGGCSLVGLPVTTGEEPDSVHTLFRTPGAIHHLQMAADRRGGVLMAWTHEIEGEFQVMAKHIDLRGKHWDEEPAVLGVAGRHPVEIRLTMNRRGQAVVAWNEKNVGSEGVMACYFFPSMNQWSDRPVMVAEGLVQDFQLALDHAGSLMLLLVRQEYGQRPRLEAMLHSAATSTWLPAEVLAHPWELRQVRLAMTGSGDAMAAWLQSEGSSAAYLHVRGFRAGVWEESSTRLEPEQGLVEQFSLAMGPRGRVTVLSLVRHKGERFPVVHEKDRSWSRPMAVGGRIEEPMTRPLVELSNGGAIALWRSGEGDRARLRLALRHGGAEED
jgi:hypothetical protein